MGALYNSTKLCFVPVKSEEELGQCAALADMIWHEHYTPIIGAEQVDYMVEHYQSPEAMRESIQTGCRYYLLYADGRPVGYFAVEPENPAGKLFLSKIYVCKEARGAGVGRFACEAVFDMARKEKLRAVWLTVNKHNSASIAAYKKLGFVQVDSVVTPIGNGFVMDDYIMERTV